MNMQDNNQIYIKDLNIAIDGAELIKHMDFHIGKGEIVALVGESGCGKTLTSKFILDLLPERAEVNVAEFHKNAKVGAIFQNAFSCLNPTVKIGTQLRNLYYSHFKNSPQDWREVVVPILEKVGIQNIDRFLKKYPHECSGGERQRVVTAGALIPNPGVIIADEVTTALDLRTKTAIINFFARLRAETGMSILFITHDLVSIKGFADRVYVMYKGEIVEENTCENIFSIQTHPYVERLIGFTKTLWTREER